MEVIPEKTVVFPQHGVTGNGKLPEPKMGLHECGSGPADWLD